MMGAGGGDSLKNRDHRAPKTHHMGLGTGVTGACAGLRRWAVRAKRLASVKRTHLDTSNGGLQGESKPLVGTKLTDLISGKSGKYII